ncbi:MAG: PAS domain S-box protein [Bacteroidales bacterium]|nr:PAS domain S-box protein [Bacteroidales bacterium]
MTDVFRSGKSNQGPELLNLRNRLVNGLLVILVAIGLPTLIMAIVSAKYTGNFPVLSTIGYSLIVLVWSLRKYIPFYIKTGVLLLIGYLIGTLALVSEGIISDGLLYYVTISVISAILLNTVHGVAIMLLSMLTAGIIAFSYQKGWIEYDFDTVSYINSPEIWMAYILITLLFTSGIIILSDRLNIYLYRTIKNLTANTQSLNEANKKLEQEVEYRKSVESSLENSARTFQNIFNSINDAIIIFDAKNNITEANQAFYDFTGYNREEVSGLKMQDLFDNYERIQAPVSRDDINLFSPYRNETSLKTKNRSHPILVETALIPFSDLKSRSKLIILRDITETRELERITLNAIIQAEEKERTRVSQDLHDSLGPLLSAIKLYSNSIVNADDGNKRKEIHTKITELMDEAVKTVKEISNNLSSHVLKNFGFLEAIHSFTEKIELNHPIKIVRDFEEDLKISETIQIILYRVLVELINNTLKYAYASEIKIKLRSVKGKILIVYKDNGHGFDVERAIGSGKGLGLYNIHSRIKSLGGTISMKSKEGKGILVEIQV